MVRVPHDQGSAAALAAEARLLAGLEARGIPFVHGGARPLLDAFGAPLGMTTRYVEGIPASTLMLRGAVRERLARDLGTFLSALHAVPTSAARRLGVSGADLWRARYVPLIEECRPYLGPAVARDLATLVHQFEGLHDEAPRVLIHGDISGEHVRVTPEAGISGVIDFGDAILGDPALDFAGILNDWPRSFLARVLSHYAHEVTSVALRRTECFIALAPLYAVRHSARSGDPQALRAGLGLLSHRVRAAVVQGRVGP